MTRSISKKNQTKDAELVTELSSSTTNAGIKQVTPIKSKKKKCLKKGPKKSPKKPPKKLGNNNTRSTKMDIIYTETVGEFVVATVYRQDGTPGYVYPILKAIRDGNNDLANDCMFDCRIKEPLFIRHSRKVNEKVDLNVLNKSLYQLGFVSSPDTQRFKIPNVSSDNESTLSYEKLFRDEIEKILLDDSKASGKGITTEYEAWDPSKHSKTNNPNRKMDDIFIDQSVHDILESYYIQGDHEDHKVYDYLQEYSVQVFYSRFNGEYSTSAKKLGFPKVKVEDGIDSEYDSDSSDD